MTNDYYTRKSRATKELSSVLNTAVSGNFVNQLDKDYVCFQLAEKHMTSERALKNVWDLLLQRHKNYVEGATE